MRSERKTLPYDMAVTDIWAPNPERPGDWVPMEGDAVMLRAGQLLDVEDDEEAGILWCTIYSGRLDGARFCAERAIR